MISEPRTIARIVELFHIPIQHTPELLRAIYLAVSSSCGYDNFVRVSGGARLEAAPGEGTGGTSRVLFLKDRISFHDELNNVSLEHFLRRIEEVVNVATEKLSVPIFIARNITVRTVAGAPRGQHASQFLAENLFQLDPEALQPLGRPAQLVGFRMLFPPADPKGGTHQVRIEAYLRDPRSLFIEDMATFKIPVQPRDRARVAEELREVDDFIQERVSAFLSQFPRT
jgi:hypothetical protein